MLTTPDIVVSRAGYGTGTLFAASSEVRVCLRSTGRDPTLLASLGLSGYVPGATGEWILVVSPELDREGCAGGRVQAVNLRDGRRGPAASSRDCSQVPPETGAQIAVTPAGQPAWLSRDSSTAVIRIIAAR